MEALVYPRERTLGTFTLVIGLLVWVALTVGTLGIALIYLLFGFIFYLFAHSALIAYIKGNGVELSAQQFPDLHARFEACCDKLAMADRPAAYVLHGNGVFNAFATRFLGKHFVVLLSDVVDAMEANPDGVNFYIGHELGHIRMKHLTGQLLRAPALWLPLIGAAYSRARESTCDRHGRACCSSPESAARALAALAAGKQRWPALDLGAYRNQVRSTRGFWMSYHELTGGYPWLSKRVARVMEPDKALPGRHGLSYVLALFVPYLGRVGGAGGPLVLVAMIGILAAVALPAYQDYTVRAKIASTYANAGAAKAALTNYYRANRTVPESLQQAGVPDRLPDGSTLTLDPNKMVLTLGTAHGELLLVPSDDGNGNIQWQCRIGEGMQPTQAPRACEGATRR
ncbi:M48 family metalloprotease [Piscinibacter sp.]|uniref:M48 family metalloprotease n=1 Tax=Piscinibacter sp. TaxID=1903157 RepID=UPI0035594DA4